MQKFVAPQFIDVEDKIIGPITVRQFIIGVVAGFFIFLSYKFSDLGLFIIEAIGIVTIYVLIGFIKINGQHFHLFVASILKSILSAQIRVWNKTDLLPSFEKTSLIQEKTGPAPAKIRPLTGLHELSSLSLLIDTGGKYKPEEVLRRQANTVVN